MSVPSPITSPAPAPVAAAPVGDVHAAVAALAALLPGRVVTDPGALEAYRTDRSGKVAVGTPAAVVEAQSVSDVQTACRVAHDHGVPIVTRGAGTGLAGGAIAGAGEIVVSTRAMDRLLYVSTTNRTAVVEPGILNAALNDLLEADGLWWPPDPASRAIATVGGNIATNAGGLLCAKYGVTRESVLALDVVLADGSLISVGHGTVKGVTGLDLCALMIGSEGTLGIIVGATLKLRPLVRGPIAAIRATFPTTAQAAATAAEVVRRGHTPAIMELMDSRTIECIERDTGAMLGSDGGALLLIQTDDTSADDDAAAIAQILTEAGAQVARSTDRKTADEWMALRRAAFPALEKLGTLLVEDVCVPLDRMGEMFAHIRSVEERYGVEIPTACHAGDGNLHPTFTYRGAAVPQNVWAAADDIFTYALRLGGTLSGEHGIGVLKRRWLGDELGDVQVELQRQIKNVFDPAGLLNPGKVFPEPV